MTSRRTIRRSIGDGKGDDPHIYVDADACPVKAEVVKVAGRHGLPVVFVADAVASGSRPAWLLVAPAARGPHASTAYRLRRITS